MVRGAHLFEPTDHIGLARGPPSALELGRAYAWRQAVAEVNARRVLLDGIGKGGSEPPSAERRRLSDLH